jgi:predicted O-methyltransferase YrrM
MTVQVPEDSSLTVSGGQPPTVYRTEAIVGTDGHVSIGGVPFDAHQTVDVIVLPPAYRDRSQQLLDLVLRAAHPQIAYRFRDASVPAHPSGFEDLLFLFELSPLNRGLVRLDFDEALAVFTMVSVLDRPRGIEIGRFSGGSTFLLAVAVGPDGRVDSIDIAPQDDEALSAALTLANLHDRVELIVADAQTHDAGADAGQFYDFAFIDGDHSYEGARRDHNHWGARVRPGGLIIHHDMGRSRRFASQLHDLARLKDDICRMQHAELELVRETGSVAIFRRTSPVWTGIADAGEHEGQDV